MSYSIPIESLRSPGKTFKRGISFDKKTVGCRDGCWEGNVVLVLQEALEWGSLAVIRGGVDFGVGDSPLVRKQRCCLGEVIVGWGDGLQQYQ